MKKVAKVKLSIKKTLSNLFSKFLGFEQGIDITDDVAVLHRRNVVIKNIIFISNNLYSLILLTVSIVAASSGSTAGWFFTVLSFPLTFCINQILKKLINTDKTDKTKQQVAMYVAALYMFLSSILIYARLYSNEYLTTGAYILIYYAVVVISLYQDKKLLSTSFLLMLVIMTIVHFVWTYGIYSNNYTLGEFFKALFTKPEFGDIILRTVFFILFYVVVYAITSIGQYMQVERKNELQKRRQVQNDFTNIVSDLFGVVFSYSHSLMNEEYSNQVLKISDEIAKYYGLTEESILEMKRYAVIHKRYEEVKNILSEETKYELLKEKTELGALIARRMQLAQKCEDIVRAHVEGSSNNNFLTSMLDIQPEIESQIILLADMYITMRSTRTYKRPYSHSAVMKIFEEQLSQYFSFTLKERFLRFGNDVEVIYNNF